VRRVDGRSGRGALTAREFLRAGRSRRGTRRGPPAARNVSRVGARRRRGCDESSPGGTLVDRPRTTAAGPPGIDPRPPSPPKDPRPLTSRKHPGLDPARRGQRRPELAPPRVVRGFDVLESGPRYRQGRRRDQGLLVGRSHQRSHALRQRECRGGVPRDVWHVPHGGAPGGGARVLGFDVVAAGQQRY